MAGELNEAEIVEALVGTYRIQAAAHRATVRPDHLSDLRVLLTGRVAELRETIAQEPTGLVALEDSVKYLAHRTMTIGREHAALTVQGALGERTLAQALKICGIQWICPAPLPRKGDKKKG